MHGGDHQQVAVQPFLDLGRHTVVHVEGVVVRQFVYDDTVRQLHGQPVFVHGNLLHVVPTLDPHLLLSNEMLDDDVCHEVAVGVAVLVEAVHRGEDELVHGDGAILASHRYVVLLGPRLCTPNPRLTLRDGGETRTLLGDQSHLFVCSSHTDVLPIAEVRHRAGIKAHVFVFANLDARKLIERQGAVPASNREDVVSLVPRRVPAQRPNRSGPLNQNLFGAALVSNADVAVELPKRQVLAVVSP
mmetsp:Transcript_33875/g.46913  ORF Transcript_33875/g.46913 Transcript_33875/m.46913 type:complete len:244 (-) Transcript_33875:493-1224(-)